MVDMIGGKGGRWAGFVGLLLLVGCIDLVPVGPPPGQPSVLQLVVRIADPGEGGGVAVQVSGTLLLGIDRGGRPHEVVAPELVVLGRTIVPVQIDAETLRYQEEVRVSLTELSEEPLVIAPPGVLGVASGPVQAHWPVFARIGAAEPTAEGGLRLQLSTSRGRGAPLPDTERWSLTLFRGTAWASQGSEGLPPAELFVDPDLIPSSEGPLQISLNVDQTGTLPVVAGEYVVRLQLSQNLLVPEAVMPAAAERAIVMPAAAERTFVIPADHRHSGRPSSFRRRPSSFRRRPESSKADVGWGQALRHSGAGHRHSGAGRNPVKPK